MVTAPATTRKQQQRLLRRPIDTRWGRARIVGWSGHDNPWPLVKLYRDPHYFAPICLQDPDALAQALRPRRNTPPESEES